MVSTTKSRTSRPRRPEVEAFRTEAGELWWRCPDCRNTHHESVRACNCGRVRPVIGKLIEALEAAERSAVSDQASAEAGGGTSEVGNQPPRAVGLENGRVAWQCTLCGCMNADVERACGKCGASGDGPRGLIGAPKPLRSSTTNEHETAIETVVLAFRLASHIEAVIELQPQEEAWAERVTWRTTGWLRDGRDAEDRAMRGTTEKLAPHREPPCTTREEALEFALSRLGAAVAMMSAAILTPVGLTARQNALTDLQHERRRLLGSAAAEPQSAEKQKGAKARGRTSEVRGQETAPDAGPPSPLTAHRSPLEASVATSIPLRAIVRRDDNPRTNFDQDKLQQLAESIRGVGLISAIVVREEHGGRYQLWAGERRVRACELLGWTTIPARVFPAETPDATMEAIRAWENLQREDLDPLEEARSLQLLLASGAYASQKALGEAVGLSQAEVSLRLRLTELPEAWQQRVIAHEISTSHAKHLYPWIDLPAVLEKAEQQAAGWEKSHGRKPSERDFQSIVQNAARAASKPIGKGDAWTGRNGCPFTVTKALRAQLDVRPVPQPWGGKPEPRAFNVRLWNQTAKEAQQSAAEEAKTEKKKTKSKGESPPAVAAGPNRYEVKRRIGEWARAEIRARLKSGDKKLLQRLLLLSAACEGSLVRSTWLVKRLKIKIKGWPSDGALWQALAAADEQTIAALPYEMLTASEDDVNLDEGVLLAIARGLGAAPETEWRPHPKDLTVYTDKQLLALAKAHGYDVGKAKGKSAIISALLKVWKAGDLPQAFRDVLEREAD